MGDMHEFYMVKLTIAIPKKESQKITIYLTWNLFCVFTNFQNFSTNYCLVGNNLTRILKMGFFKMIQFHEFS